MFAWWGQFVDRPRWAVLGVSAVMLASSIVALLNGGTLKNSGGRNTESGRALALMQDQLPQNGAGSSFVLVFGSDSMAVTDPSFKQAMVSALQPLKADARVKTVETPFGVLARFTDVSTYSTNIVTLIGLGVAIDYSLFIVNRFREELSAGRTVEQALIASMRTSGRAVTFSGITVAIGLSAMLFFQGSFLASMGFAGAIVVAIAVLYALTFLAALLAILGHRVNWARLPLPRRTAGRGLWHGLAIRVLRRPLLVLLPVVALLMLMAPPFLQSRRANGGGGRLPQNAE